MTAGHILKEIKITSTSNEYIKKLKRAFSARADKSGIFLIEGRKMLEEALGSGWSVETVIYDGARADISEISNLGDDARVISADKRVIEYLSDTVSPQGIVAAVRMKRGQTATLSGRYGLVLDGVRDPGNLGTLIRTSEAFGSGFVIAYDCCDPYSPKSVRSTMGSIFRQNIYCIGDCDTLKELIEAGGYRLIGAADRAESRAIHELDKSFKSAVVIGSEAAGISMQIGRMCDEFVRIPMAGRVESLNAAMAGGVLLWEFYKEKSGVF